MIPRVRMGVRDGTSKPRPLDLQAFANPLFWGNVLNHDCVADPFGNINSVHTKCIAKTSGFTRGVCENRGLYLF